MVAETYSAKGGGNANHQNAIRPMVSSRTMAYEPIFGVGSLTKAQRTAVGAERRANSILSRYPYTQENVRRVANALSNMRRRILPFGWNG